MADAPAPPNMDEVLPKDRVPVVDKNGKLGSVPEANYARAVEQGFRFQTPEEQTQYHGQLKHGNSPVKAGLAGAVRGATLGLSDLAAPNLGIASRETLAGLKEQNEGASIAGDLAGTAASLLIPGAQEATLPGIVSKLGRAVEGGLAVEKAGLVGRLLPKLAGGAVEGSLYGAGNSVSEASLGNSELNAEKLLAGGGLGMVLGAAGGGLGGVFEEGAAAAGKAISKAAGKGDLATFLGAKAEDFGAKAIGGIQQNFKGMSREEVREVARDVMDAGLIGKGESAATILPKIQAAKKEAGEAIGSILKQADDMAIDAGKQVAGSAIEATTAGKGQVLGGGRFDFEPAKQRLGKFFAELNPAEQDLIEGSIKKALDQMDRAGARDGAGFVTANDLKATLQGEINYKVDMKAKTNLLKQAVGIFRDEIDTQLKRAVPAEVFEQFAKSKKLFGSFSEAEKWGKRGVAALQGNRGFSLTDHIAGAGLGALSGGPMGLAAGAAGAIGNKVLRERGPSFAAGVLDSIANHPSLSLVAKSFQNAVQKTNPEMLGSYGPALMAAAARGPGEALLTHAHLAQTEPGYQESVALAGFPRETPEEHAQVMDRAQSLSVVGHELESHDDYIERAVERVFKGSPTASKSVLSTQDFGAQRMRQTSLEAHKRRVDEVRKLASDPNAFVERTGGNLEAIGKHAPAIAASMAATASRAVQYLANEARTPDKAGPLAKEWVPTQAERHSFVRKLEVVQEPMSVLKHAAAGTLSEDQMQAFQAVYPGLAKQIGEAALRRIADNPKSVPYKSRVMLSLLTGMDLDGTMNGAAIRSNQNAIHATQEAQPPGGPQSGARNSEQTLAQRTATPSQRHEMESQ